MFKKIKNKISFHRNMSLYKSVIKTIKLSGKFKADWYLKQYPDVRSNRRWSAHPELHYLLIGASEGRDPAPFFDTKWYLEENSDVAKSTMNPLYHYIIFGQGEGRVRHADTLLGGRQGGRRGRQSSR